MRSFRWLAALLVLSAWAADSPLDTLLKAVETRYNRAGTLQIEFNEAYTLPNRPSRTEVGLLSLRKPGKMRWDYTKPLGKLFLSDGKSIYLYTPANKQVEKMKLKESDDMRAPLAFLLGKLKFSKEFQNITSRQEGSLTIIAAQPKVDSLPYTDVEFVVTPDARIQRVKVAGYDKSVLEFTFSNEKLNPALNSKMFDFQMPPGAQLVEGGQ